MAASEKTVHPGEIERQDSAYHQDMNHHQNTDHPQDTDHQEVEWQFEAPDLELVERWLLDHSNGLSLDDQDGKTTDQVDIYFDTEDWRLYQAGFTVRIRRKGDVAEATLKSLSSGDQSVLSSQVRSRREITETVREVSPEALRLAPGPVGERVRLLTGPHKARPLFEIHNHRRSFEFSMEGARAGEIALDDFTIPLGDEKELAHLYRVEVEMRGDIPPEMEKFLEQMQDACQLTPTETTKYEEGMLAHGLAPSTLPDLGPDKISASLSIGEIAFAVLRKQFRRFLQHEPGTRLGEDPEELHDMRVAIRRMRAAISLFEEVLPVRIQHLREEMKHVAAALGEVRDLDVQLEQFEVWAKEASPEDRAPLQALSALLEEQRLVARKRMLRLLDTRRYERLVKAFTQLLQRGPSRRLPQGRQSVLGAAPALVVRRYRKFRKAGDKLTPDSPPGEYHCLRIRGKRLRYALEFFSDVYDGPLQTFVESLVELQDLLGLHQDAQVASDQLHDLNARYGRRLGPKGSFVMGGIDYRYTAQANELRKNFPKVYGQLRGKNWKKLHALLQDRCPAVTKEDVGVPTPIRQGR